MEFEGGVGEKRECVSLGLCTLSPFAFPTTTDRYMEYFREFTNKSLLQGKWYHGLHNMFRRDSLRSMHAFFRPTLRLKENPQETCHAEVKFQTWVLRFSLSSLPLSILSLEKQLERIDHHNCIHLKEIFTFVSHQRDGCLFQKPEKANSKVPLQVFTPIPSLYNKCSFDKSIW